jgi:hypothetical protein
MSKVGFHDLPRCYRLYGCFTPANAAELMLIVCGVDAVSLVLEHALKSGFEKDWFALRYWLRTLAALEREVFPPSPVEGFKPLVPQSRNDGDGKMGREW